MDLLKEKRINLTHGAAVVSKDVSQETIDALNNMVTLAYEQISKESMKKKSNWPEGFDYKWGAVLDGCYSYYYYPNRIFCQIIGSGDHFTYGFRLKSWKTNNK